jgi:xylulokinase
MSIYLGIDVGTSGTKTLAMNERGKILGQALATYPCYHPKPLWSEQDPDDWWQATMKTVRAVVKKAKLKPADVKAIGLSGQMHGSVFLDKQNRVVRRALLWNDQRTAAECDEIERRAGGRRQLIAMVANPALTGFTAPKINGKGAAAKGRDSTTAHWRVCHGGQRRQRHAVIGHSSPALVQGAAFETGARRRLVGQVL